MSVIQVHAVFAVKSGSAGVLRELLTAASAMTREHAGVLGYQFYANADDSRFVALETYKDAASFGAHMAEVGDTIGALMAHIDGMDLSVFGDVPDELRAAFESMGPAYYSRIAGFTLGE